MSKVQLTKCFEFEMAHALYGYDGPCKNIHGHSYKLEVSVIGSPLEDSTNPKCGMVMDFSDLSKIVKERIISKLDHALVLNANSPHKEINDKEYDFEKVIHMPFQPTCENLLLDCVNKIQPLLPKSVQLHRVRLRETASSCAEWHATDN